MSLTITATNLIYIASSAALIFSVAIALFILMYLRCCKVSRGDLADGGRHRRRERNAAGQGGLSSSGEASVAERECRGIPLHSRPPRLTPEQEILRDKAMRRYRRRQAREEHRRQRQAAREACVVEVLEGDGEGMMSEGEFADGSSVTSRTTLTSATTVRTTSTVAYGHSSYLLPSPGACAVDVDEHDDREDQRSARSGSSRRSSSTARSRASQGTAATVKSYMRHRQRQRLRRREAQQKADLFNQWAYAQMASSVELSTSSNPSESSQCDEEGSATGGGVGRRNRTAGGGHSSGHAHRNRTASVASSAPRPPEEVLGADCVAYPFLMNGAHHDAARAKAENEPPASYSMTVNAPDRGDGLAPSSPFMHSNGATGVASPNLSATGHLGHAGHGGSGVGTGECPDRLQLRRHKRTWKDVEHNVALSGFFHSPANVSSIAGVDTPSPSHCNDGEAPYPFSRAHGDPARSSCDLHEPICHE
ncbi:hypothetical protein LSCM1_01498 [Leishmania martiniquensis]|uniref:Uncharacterized protein n=1 Tax=Leishmania martiniquensis TaxID=1580590 RepID=A0A836KG27_9TRYP|nr:hypothetical protein LSCM1_01498 [Leishmania martiniquensis]